MIVERRLVVRGRESIDVLLMMMILNGSLCCLLYLNEVFGFCYFSSEWMVVVLVIIGFRLLGICFEICEIELCKCVVVLLLGVVRVMVLR